MPDWDAVIIGGGPAGLAAGLYLGRGGWRTLLIEKESVGGYIMNVEFIENYPGYPDGVVGSQLAMEMKNQALKYGLQTQRGEVNGLQGVPGENSFMGNGVITCAFCDGGQFAGQVMAVVGGGDSGVTGALYMANIASKVILIEAMPECTATAILRERAEASDEIEIRCGTSVEAMTGNDRLEGIDITGPDGNKETLTVEGVLVHVGLDPRTDYLQDVLLLNDERQIIVNEWMETKVPGIYAAGDIRSGSPGQVSTAVGDGATAAMAAQRYLQTLS
jgi:thioredoxin reductase (NADPH)